MRMRLDDFYSCLDCCLNHIHAREAFQDMCNVLNKELQALIESLRLLEDALHEELPLESEEPKGVNWGDESERLIGFRNMFLMHDFTLHSDLYVKMLMDSLTDASKCMGRIDEDLIPIENSQLYVSYSKRELANYSNTRWVKEKRNLLNDVARAPISRQNEYMSRLLKKEIEALRLVDSYIISDDFSYIYHEAIGRSLWNIRISSNPDYSIEDILVKIKTVEFLSSRIEQKLVFIDCENNPEEETEETRLMHSMEETLQNQLPKVVFRLKSCSEFLDKAFSHEFFDEMLRKLIDSKHSSKVCEKMSNRKFKKFTLQIAGLLKGIDVFCECSYKDLAKAIGFKQLTMESSVDYIRKQIDDEPEIQQWITDYTVQYRNSHNGS